MFGAFRVQLVPKSGLLLTAQPGQSVYGCIFDDKVSTAMSHDPVIHLPLTNCLESGANGISF